MSAVELEYSAEYNVTVSSITAAAVFGNVALWLAVVGWMVYSRLRCSKFLAPERPSFFLDRWCRSFYQWVFGTPKDDLRDAVQANMNDLIINVKLAAIFLLIFAPDSLRSFHCALPSVLANEGLFDAVIYDLAPMPCPQEEGFWGNNLFDIFAEKSGLSAHQKATAEIIVGKPCEGHVETYFNVVFFEEVITLIYLSLRKEFLFIAAGKNTLIFLFTSLLWGLFTLTMVVGTEGVDPATGEVGFVGRCMVPYGPLVVAVFSIWHLITAMVLSMAAHKPGTSQVTEMAKVSNSDEQPAGFN